jgi:hypothetical protein
VGRFHPEPTRDANSANSLASTDRAISLIEIKPKTHLSCLACNDGAIRRGTVLNLQNIELREPVMLATCPPILAFFDSLA